MPKQPDPGVLQVESLETTLKAVTFDMSKLSLWKNPYGGEHYTRHMISHWDNEDSQKIALDCLYALKNAQMIRDVQNMGPNFIYVDARPWPSM